MYSYPSIHDYLVHNKNIQYTIYKIYTVYNIYCIQYIYRIQYIYYTVYSIYTVYRIIIFQYILSPTWHVVTRPPPTIQLNTLWEDSSWNLLSRKHPPQSLRQLQSVRYAQHTPFYSAVLFKRVTGPSRALFFTGRKIVKPKKSRFCTQNGTGRTFSILTNLNKPFRYSCSAWNSVPATVVGHRFRIRKYSLFFELEK